MYIMQIEINYFDEIYSILKNSNKKWLYVNTIYKRIINNVDKSFINDDFQQIFLLHLMTINCYYKDVCVVYNNDGCLEYVICDGNSCDEDSCDDDSCDEDSCDEDSNEMCVNNNIFVSCPGCSDDDNDEDENNEDNDEDYIPDEDEDEDEYEDEYDDEDDDEDDEESNELLYLLTKDDVIDYAVDNSDIPYIRQLILKYKENDNNIMHILFSNKKNKEIEKLLNNESIYLLTEENKEGKCPIDYVNNTILKKIIKECIKNNNNLNKDIDYLYKHSFELKESIYYLSITLSCSMLFILFGLARH